MTYSDAPQPPQPPTIPEDWEHHDLYEQVLEALQVLPSYFKTATFIEGIQATDIFTLNSALGATIESQVVASLNLMRPVWDPDEKYQLYSFQRRLPNMARVGRRNALFQTFAGHPVNTVNLQYILH